MGMTTAKAPTTAPTSEPAAANPDALPTAGGSYTRQPDGTLVPTQPIADTAPTATPE